MDAEERPGVNSLIQILPDAVANQIAAGEVVQRPASVIKELMENSVDSGADLIEVIVKEGGVSFIQVHDNGCGMSETDARLCFERHATSKIRNSEDLFEIHTKGFRGEALASILAVAQVSLVTRRKQDPHGTNIRAEASKILSQEPTAAEPGTSITIKNLFFNVPARRKFLKSEKIELRHIIEEFQRVALAHPGISFALYDNHRALYRMDAGNLRQRLVQVFGAALNEKLVPVSENTDLVRVSGFLVKPEFAKKTRGEQYFFVNDRYIKSSYLHHAISKAYEDLLPQDTIPGYFIYLEVEPSRMDINIHPTKTEVKFEDESMIYAVLRSAVRQALGKFYVTPSLDFDRETAFEFQRPDPDKEIHAPEIKVNTSYNPFEKEKRKEGPKFGITDQFYAPMEPSVVLGNSDFAQPTLISHQAEEEMPFRYFQINQQYIVTRYAGELVIIDQHRAHERVLYERLIEQMQQQQAASQQLLYPETLEFDPSEISLLEEMIPLLQKLGFDIDLLGISAVVVRGVPPDAMGYPVRVLLEEMLEQYMHAPSVLKQQKDEVVARSLASRMAVRNGIVLDTMEAANLVKDLFKCKMPYVALNGRPVVMQLSREELDERFGYKGR